LVVTSDGGYALAGYAGHTGPFSAGSGDFWLVKTDASGNMMWNQTYGGTNFDAACSLVVTSDGGYAIAGFTSSFGAGDNDFWLVKTDASGNMMWNQTYGGTGDDYAFSLVAISDGGYAVTGETRSFKAEGSDWLLVKTDESGNMMWNQTYGGTNYGGRAHSLIVTSDGTYVIAGDSSSTGETVDFCLVKAAASGEMIWQKTYGEGIDDSASSLVQTSDGGYALTGYTSSGAGTDALLVKTDSEGNLEWSQTYGGTGDDAASSVVQTGDGGYAIAADTTSFGAGGYDFWLIKTEGGDMPEDTTEPPPALALPMEYVYVAVVVVVIAVVVIGIFAYTKRK